jgi:6-phosphogluconate dehydrogenase (decarboxylating)
MSTPKKTPVGKVTNFYSKISVAVVELSAPLKRGDKIAIEGGATNFQQTADSMQIDRKDIPGAKAGQSIGLKVIDKVRPGDTVYKLG